MSYKYNGRATTKDVVIYIILCLAILILVGIMYWIGSADPYVSNYLVGGNI